MKEINFPSHRLTAQNFHRTSKNISSVLGKCSTLICPAGFDCLFLCAQQPHPGGFYFVLLPNTRDVAQPLNNYHLHFSITHGHRNQYIFSGMNRDFCLSYLLKLVASFSLTSPWEMNSKDELIAQHGKTHTPTPTHTHTHTHTHTIEKRKKRRRNLLRFFQGIKKHAELLPVSLFLHTFLTWKWVCVKPVLCPTVNQA